MADDHVIILGAGPAGLGAAFRLRWLDRARVTVIERQETVGGNAGSFEMGGQYVDYGSHRLHPTCDPHILKDLRLLLGDALIQRPRHGRILLRGKWIHFPLKPVDLLLRLDKGFALGALRDMVVRTRDDAAKNDDTLAAVLKEGLGKTICDSFYFPYARKIWGREPKDLSGIQARRRVSANSFSKLMAKVLAQPKGRNRVAKVPFFYYPKKGFGQISDQYADAARERGAEFMLGWTAIELRRVEGDPGKWCVVAERDGEQTIVEADHIWSTIPLTVLARIFRPDPPVAIVTAARSLKYRSMLLIYLQLPVGRFTEYDAHYFPEASLSITRLSEPKNYSGTMEPAGSTVLCAELPCSPEDRYWSMSNIELTDVIARDLARAGIPLPAPPSDIIVKRLPQAYPIYEVGYERHFGVLDEWCKRLPGVLSFGRQGLFAHDNTHHALYMAYSAVDCLDHGGFDLQRWHEYRKIFDTHVVED